MRMVDSTLSYRPGDFKNIPLSEHSRFFCVSTVNCFDRVQQKSSFSASTTHSTAFFTPLRTIRCWKPCKRPS